MTVEEKLLNRELKKAIKTEPGLNAILDLTKKIPSARVYLVGGIIRDWLLKRESYDYDFVVSGVPAKKLEAYLKEHGSVNLVGKRFGVFKFVPKKTKTRQALDIALPRTEHAWGTGGYRDVKTQSDWKLPIEKDLARRDFTINALALELVKENGQSITGNLLDHFNGLADLKKRILRTVGEPQERFQEDYSRLLRGLRLACQLGFEIEKNTWQALVKLVRHLNDVDENGERVVPYEVIAKELVKALVSAPQAAFDLWDKAGGFAILIPEMLKMKNCPQPPQFHAEGDVWIHTRIALSNLTTPGFQSFVKTLPKHLQNNDRLTPQLVLATMFHDIGKPDTLQTPEKNNTDRIRTPEHDVVGARLAKAIGERLKLSSAPDLPCDVEKMAWLVQRHMLAVQGLPEQFANRTIEKYFFNPLLPGDELLKLIYADQMATYVNGKPQLGSLPFLVKRIKQLVGGAKHRAASLPPPLLNGDEIMKLLKLASGPRVGEIKEWLREEQLAGRIKNKIAAKKTVLKKFYTD